MSPSVALFGNSPADQPCHDAIVGAFPQVDSALVKTAVNAGLPWMVILQLLVTFGPQVFQILNDLLGLFNKPGGLTLFDVGVMIQKYGPGAQSVIAAILAALKKPMPTA